MPRLWAHSHESSFIREMIHSRARPYKNSFTWDLIYLGSHPSWGHPHLASPKDYPQLFLSEGHPHITSSKNRPHLTSLKGHFHLTSSENHPHWGWLLSSPSSSPNFIPVSIPALICFFEFESSKNSRTPGNQISIPVSKILMRQERVMAILKVWPVIKFDNIEFDLPTCHATLKVWPVSIYYHFQQHQLTSSMKTFEQICRDSWWKWNIME